VLSKVASYFSTLKAGRDAAACIGKVVGADYARISVPSKRVETLPLGSKIGGTWRISHFSTLKAGRDAAALISWLAALYEV